MTDSKTRPVRVRDALAGLNITLVFRASGHKSSEGDGRTAADVERELAERRNKKTWD